MKYLAVLWLVCGVLTFGITNAYFKNEFYMIYDPMQARETMGMSAAFALMGPISLAVSFFSSGFAAYGLDYTTTPPGPDRYNEMHKKGTDQ